jgi:MFS family permease
MEYVDSFTFLIPLYGLSLGLDAVEIGILLRARSILALFLSIHIGVLMDRFGTRRVTLFFVWTRMALPPLFPLAPGFWALLALQLVNGAGEDALPIAAGVMHGAPPARSSSGHDGGMF